MYDKKHGKSFKHFNDPELQANYWRNTICTMSTITVIKFKFTIHFSNRLPPMELDNET